MKPEDPRTVKRPAVTPLGQLIGRLALDVDLHQAFLDDPDTVIAPAGLSPDEQEALRRGDWRQIVKRLGPLPPPAKRYALVIGIDDYPYAVDADLQGCYNDAVPVHQTAVG